MRNFVEIDDRDESMIAFKKALDKISSLIDFTASNASQQIQFEPIGTNTYIIQGEALEAANHTLSSIFECSKRARFSDAFTLVRKFRDDLIQYLFIIFTLDGIQSLTEEEVKNYIGDGMDSDNSMYIISLIYEILSSGRRKKPQEKAIDSWLENTLSNDDHSQDRKQYFGASKYISLLKKDEVIKECFELYFELLWTTIDRSLNNYVHSNGSQYIRSNLPGHIYSQRKNMILQLTSIIRDLMVIFISLLILVKPTFIQSNDYIDYLEMGETPPDGSQYWISPIVQNFIDTDIVQLSPCLKKFLRDNNRYNMRIE